MVALPLLVYDLTGSERQVGVIAVVQTVPRVLLSPVAGILLDRIDRRKLMLAADAERALLVALIPFTVTVWQIAVIAALVGVGGAIGRPAEMAAVPAVAGKARLVRALSLAQVTGATIRVLVPAIGAGLIAAGLFTADPGAGFPAGAPEGAPVLSWHGILHEASHLVVVVAWIALCFVLRTRFAREGARGWARACVAAVPIVIALVAFPHLDSFPVRIVVASVLQLGFVGLAARRLGRPALPR
jgi:MFS family permease